MNQPGDTNMWVEKYRPKTLDEVVNLKDIVESLQGFLRTPETMPHHFLLECRALERLL